MIRFLTLQLSFRREAKEYFHGVWANANSGSSQYDPILAASETLQLSFRREAKEYFPRIWVKSRDPAPHSGWRGLCTL